MESVSNGKALNILYDFQQAHILHDLQQSHILHDLQQAHILTFMTCSKRTS